MQLFELLDSPQAHHLRERPIVFKAQGVNARGERVVVDARAALRFVDEQARREAYRDADKETRKEYEGQDPPVDRLANERNLHLLYRALRDADDPSRPLARSILELRQCLILDEAQRVFAEYQAWVDEEFPPAVNESKWAALVEDAKKKSLFDLLTESGYASTLKVLRSLAGLSG